MLANIRFEISISYVLQKSQLFVYTVNSSNRAKRLERGWKWRVRQWAREAYAPCAWFSRRRLAPARGNWSWKKTTGLATVWQSKACVQPYGRGTRLIRCHSNFSIPGPALVSPVIKSLVWVTPIGNSQNTDTVSDYWTGEGRVIQEAKCIFLLYSTGLRFYFT